MRLRARLQKLEHNKAIDRGCPACRARRGLTAMVDVTPMPEGMVAAASPPDGPGGVSASSWQPPPAHAEVGIFVTRIARVAGEALPGTVVVPDQVRPVPLRRRAARADRQQRPVVLVRVFQAAALARHAAGHAWRQPYQEQLLHHHGRQLGQTARAFPEVTKPAAVRAVQDPALGHRAEALLDGRILVRAEEVLRLPEQPAEPILHPLPALLRLRPVRRRGR